MDALVSVLVEAETKQDAGYLKRAMETKLLLTDNPGHRFRYPFCVARHPGPPTKLHGAGPSHGQFMSGKLRREAKLLLSKNQTLLRFQVVVLWRSENNSNHGKFCRVFTIFICTASRGDVKAINGLFPSEFSEICRCTAAVASQADQRENAPLVLQAFKRVIIELGGIFPGCLFPAHIGLLKVALASQSAASTLDVLNNSIYTVEPKQTGLRTKELLLYFYYGGMIYAHVKLYKKATEFFLNCVICPSRVLSSIAIEAYKKYYLVSLLAHGIPPPELPRSVSPVVKRNAPSLVRSYKQFAEAYKRRDFPAMNIIAQENLEEFQGDDNLSLGVSLFACL